MEREKGLREIAGLIRELSPGVLADLELPREKGGGAILNFEIYGPNDTRYCLGFKHQGKGKIRESARWKLDHINVYDGEEWRGQISKDNLEKYLQKEGYGDAEVIEGLLERALEKAQEF